MAILLTGQLAARELTQWAELLQAELPEETLVTDRSQLTSPLLIDMAVVANPAPGALKHLPRLRFIQSLWAGVEGLLQDRSLPADIPLARMVDPAMNQAMAETALWAVLSLQRDNFDYARQQGQSRWQQHPQRRAADTRVLVLGLGQMGSAVAQRLVANGFVVSGWSRQWRAAHSLPGVRCQAGWDTLPTALGAADVVVNLLPLTGATRDFFDAQRLAWMAPGSSLVNLARGAHVDETALLAALDSGHLRQAVLDVFVQEPLPADHPFWRHPRVTVLPHVAAQTDPRSAALVVAANLRRWRSGQTPLHLVDRQRGY